MLRRWGVLLLVSGQGAPSLAGGILQTEAADFGGSTAERELELLGWMCVHHSYREVAGTDSPSIATFTFPASVVRLNRRLNSTGEFCWRVLLRHSSYSV